MAENNKQTKIHVSHLKKNFGDLEVLKDVSIDIHEGEVVVILGPSGSGKSTFLRCLNRLEEITDGTVIVDGYDITDKHTDINKVRENVGMVFQRPNPLAMSVYDNIAYGPRTFGVRSKSVLDGIVEESLRGAAMWDEVKDRLNKSALGLSGGQQQRLCIARSLAVEPQILLMDEPTSALDPISTGKIEELCTELKKSVTIIMVTHNMQQAFRIADKTAYFLLGEMIEMQDTKELWAHPKDKRTDDYINGRFG